MKKILVILIFLSSCSISERDAYTEYTPTVSKECDNAEALHSICYASCLFRTEGSLLEKMDNCDYQCEETSMKVSYACN
tara:strand:+ start:95 stop:331 length:237 start_codon:yes stop_codon:yes gene_type:complete